MEVVKQPKKICNVLGKKVEKIEIKSCKKDKNSVEYYVFNLFDIDNICIALNRYVLADNVEKQLFNPLTNKEIDELKNIVPDIDMSQGANIPEPGISF